MSQMTRPIVKHRISYFSQSFSTLYVRQSVPEKAGTYKCLSFSSVKFICLPVHFEAIDRPALQNTNIIASGDVSYGKYIFLNDPEYYIVALSMRICRVKDFPQVPSIEVLEWLEEA